MNQFEGKGRREKRGGAFTVPLPLRSLCRKLGG